MQTAVGRRIYTLLRCDLSSTHVECRRLLLRSRLGSIRPNGAGCSPALRSNRNLHHNLPGEADHLLGQGVAECQYTDDDHHAEDR